MKKWLSSSALVLALSAGSGAAQAGYSVGFPASGCSPAGVVTQVPAGFTGTITKGEITVFQPTAEPDVTVVLSAPDGTQIALMGPGQSQSNSDFGFTGFSFPGTEYKPLGPVVTAPTQLLKLTAICYPASDGGFSVNATVRFVQ